MERGDSMEYHLSYNNEREYFVISSLEGLIKHKFPLLIPNSGINMFYSKECETICYPNESQRICQGVFDVEYLFSNQSPIGTINLSIDPSWTQSESEYHCFFSGNFSEQDSFVISNGDQVLFYGIPIINPSTGISKVLNIPREASSLNFRSNIAKYYSLNLEEFKYLGLSFIRFSFNEYSEGLSIYLTNYFPCFE
ncbi:MAG: hypothetical protein U0176_03800 [Bacteroidia bacterium]